MHARRMIVVLSVATLTLATACGDDDGGSSSVDDGTDAGGELPDVESDVDVCTLLTSEEIEAAIDTPVDDGRPDVANSCIWDTDDPEQRSVSVHLLVGPTQEQCVSALEGDTSLTPAGAFADPAFTSYNPAAGGLADVVACTGAGQFQLIVSGGFSETDNEAELRAAAEELAQLALAQV